MSAKTKLRYWLVIGGLALGAILVIFRYASLAAGTESRAAKAPPEIARGSIVDRTGRILAVDTSLYNISIWRPETLPDRFPTEAAQLASILGLRSEDILSRYTGGEGDFYYLKKRVGSQVAKAIQAAKVGSDGKPNGVFSGVIVERVEGRLYPEKRLASHVLGFVGDANKGLAGLESRYNEDLSPDPAGTAAASSAQGLAPQGNKLVLTIDSAMQFSLEEIARKAMTDTGAQAIILLAGDARTGEILSYVAMPDFDPNVYYNSPAETWYDWPSVYAYEPGSVFKVFSLASILDIGGIDRNSTFVCDGAYRRNLPSGEKITIKCLGVHGTVDLESILEYSCNAGAAYSSDKVEPLDFYEKLCSFGFGSTTALSLKGESNGLLAPTKSWSLRSKPTIAMGQEILVTGVQMFQAATAIANNGVLLKPILVRKVLSAKDELVYENAPQAIRRVLSPESAHTILSAMETVASKTGTGWRAKVKDIRMAVKTGTAQMIDKDTRRYSETDYIASTIAIFPADEPRLILYLAIVKPKGLSYYGGQIAAPVIRDATEALLAITDLPRADSPSIEHSGTVSLDSISPVGIGKVMPDLRGVPKRLLLPLLERSDITVRIKGDGYVAGQSPAPGSAVSAGSVIELELK